METNTSLEEHLGAHKAVSVPLNKINANSWNPNVMQEDTYKALVEDIKANGLQAIDPIHVRPMAEDRFEVIDGEHRLKAVREAGYQRIWAIVHDISEEEAKAFNYRKNKERGILDPFKEAELFYSDWKEGKGKLSQAEIAREYGISESQVSQVLSRLEISKKARENFTRVNFYPTPSHLEVLARAPKDKQTKLAQEIVDKKLSVRELESRVQKAPEAKQRVKLPLEPPKYEFQETPSAIEPEIDICSNCGKSTLKEIIKAKNGLCLDCSDQAIINEFGEELFRMLLEKARSS